MNMKLIRAWVELATDRSILRRALATSGVVGVVLTMVNHGEEVLRGHLQPGHVWPIALTFIVPFVVAIVSSVATLKGQRTGRAEA